MPEDPPTTSSGWNLSIAAERIRIPSLRRKSTQPSLPTSVSSSPTSMSAVGGKFIRGEYSPQLKPTSPYPQRNNSIDGVGTRKLEGGDDEERGTFISGGNESSSIGGAGGGNQVNFYHVFGGFPPKQVLQIVGQKQRQGKQLLDDLAEYFKDKVLLEESCAKHLGKIASKNPTSNASDIGTFQDAWRQLFTQNRELQHLHSSVARQISEQVEIPCRQRTAYQEALEKIIPIEQECLKIAKEYDEQQAKMNKLQKTYNKKSEGKRAEQTAEKLVQASIAMENIKNQWQQKAPFLLGNLQKLEEARLSQMKSSCLQFCLVMGEYHRKLQEVTDATLATICQFDEVYELENMASLAAAQGGLIPSSPVFKTASRNASLSAIPQLQVSSDNLPAASNNAVTNAQDTPSTPASTAPAPVPTDIAIVEAVNTPTMTMANTPTVNTVEEESASQVMNRVNAKLFSASSPASIKPNFSITPINRTPTSSIFPSPLSSEPINATRVGSMFGESVESGNNPFGPPTVIIPDPTTNTTTTTITTTATNINNNNNNNKENSETQENNDVSPILELPPQKPLGKAEKHLICLKETIHAMILDGLVTQMGIRGEISASKTYFTTSASTKMIRLKSLPEGIQGPVGIQQGIEWKAETRSFIPQSLFPEQEGQDGQVESIGQYQVIQSTTDSSSYLPVIVQPIWRVQAGKLCLAISYQRNPLCSVSACEAVIEELTFTLTLPKDFIEKVWSKPHGNWQENKEKIRWRVDKLAAFDLQEHLILAQFQVSLPSAQLNEEQIRMVKLMISRCEPVVLKFKIKGITFTGVDVEDADDLALVEKLAISGRIIAKSASFAPAWSSAPPAAPVVTNTEVAETGNSC